MRFNPAALCLLLWDLAGCATPYTQALTAFQQGRYEEAASRFAAVLARDPGRLDALLGLGVTRYRLRDFDATVDVLGRVVSRAPENPEARLYLALSFWQKGEDALAVEHLQALLDLKPAPRLAAQIDRALGVIRLDSLSEQMRAFLAASLEDEWEQEQELRAARLAQRLYVPPPPTLVPPGPVIITPRRSP